MSGTIATTRPRGIAAAVTSRECVTATVTGPVPRSHHGASAVLETSAAGRNKQFMEQVVVWPGSEQSPGWINLHCHLKNIEPAKNGGKDWVVGWPFYGRGQHPGWAVERSTGITREALVCGLGYARVWGRTRREAMFLAEFCSGPFGLQLTACCWRNVFDE